MTTFHDRLKILYEDTKDENYRIGRKGFAEKCGLSLSLVDNYLNGYGWPTFDNFQKICKNLGVNASWMIGQSDIKYNNETRFKELARELSKSQMEAVEQYVNFLKYSVQQRKNSQLPKNENLPE